MVLQLLKIVIPVLLMLLMGKLCNTWHILGKETVLDIKKMVTDILLPLVLFNAFFTANYSSTILLTCVIVAVSCLLALGIGFLLRFLGKPYEKFLPFLIGQFEAGTLGYAFFSLLFPGQTSIFAMVDIGQTLAGVTVWLSVLRAVCTGKVEVKEILKASFRSPITIGTFLGIILGATGVGAWFLNTAGGDLYTTAITFISAPVSGLVLIMVGYDLSFNKDLLKPVLLTSLARLLVMDSLLAASAFILFRFVPFNKPLLIAFLLAYTLPAPYSIPAYVGETEDGPYISATLSLQTLVFLLQFIAIAAYSLK